jgi:hypothetical protein
VVVAVNLIFRKFFVPRRDSIFSMGFMRISSTKRIAIINGWPRKPKYFNRQKVSPCEGIRDAFSAVFCMAARGKINAVLGHRRGTFR